MVLGASSVLPDALALNRGAGYVYGGVAPLVLEPFEGPEAPLCSALGICLLLASTCVFSYLSSTWGPHASLDVYSGGDGCCKGDGGDKFVWHFINY